MVAVIKMGSWGAYFVWVLIILIFCAVYIFCMVYSFMVCVCLQTLQQSLQNTQAIHNVGLVA